MLVGVLRGQTSPYGWWYTLHRLINYYTEVLQQELNGIKEHEEIYHIEFHDESKREVNSSKLRNFMIDRCDQKVEELTTDSEN